MHNRVQEVDRGVAHQRIPKALHAILLCVGEAIDHIDAIFVLCCCREKLARVDGRVQEAFAGSNHAVEKASLRVATASLNTASTSAATATAACASVTTAATAVWIF